MSKVATARRRRLLDRSSTWRVGTGLWARCWRTAFRAGAWSQSTSSEARVRRVGRRAERPRWRRQSALSNLRFVQGDFASLAAGDAESPSLVLCVHGCNEVNRDAIEFAKRGAAAWLVLPCCLRVALYMDGSVKLPDDTRYALLCGAMAGEYDAELVESIDRRISPRAIVIGGGGVVSARRRRS